MRLKVTIIAVLVGATRSSCFLSGSSSRGSAWSSDRGGSLASSMTPSSVLTCTAIAAFAILSIHSENSMNEHVLDMKETSGEAAQLRAAGEADADRAKAFEEEAAADEREAAALSSEAVMLEVKGRQDAGGASRDEKEAEALRIEAAAKKNEASELRSHAVEDEESYENIRSQADGLSEQAARDRSIADGDYSDVPGSAFCRWWAFRRVCEAVGTAARFRYNEAAERAAAEAREALNQYQRANAIRDRAGEEIRQAETLEAEAHSDEERGAVLEEKAKKEMEDAKKEEEQAGKDRSDANADMSQSEKDTEKAKSAKARADDENDRALLILKQISPHVKSAYRDGIVAAVAACIVLGFFSFRLLAKYCMGFAWCASDYWTRAASEREDSTSEIRHVPMLVAGRSWPLFSKNGICVWLSHCVALCAAMATFEPQWVHLDEYPIRVRGGIVLVCASVAGAASSLCLFSLPSLSSANFATMSFFVSFVGELVISSFMSVLEILILLVVLGSERFSNLKFLNASLMWLLFALGSGLCFKYFKFEAPVQHIDTDDYNISISGISNEHQRRGAGVSNNELASERDALLGGDRSVPISEFDVVSDFSVDSYFGTLDDVQLSSAGKSREEKTTTQSSSTNSLHVHVAPPWVKRLKTLQFPVEILVMSYMFAIIRACVPTCRNMTALVDEASLPHIQKLWFAIVFLLVLKFTLIAVVVGVRSSQRTTHYSCPSNPSPSICFGVPYTS